jgi:hypothetical protein
MRILGWSLLWLALAAIIGATTGQNCVRYYRLSKSGLVVQGLASEMKPHEQVGYSFEVNGRGYHGVGKTGVGLPSFDQISIGDTVPIHYLPEHPWVNCVGDPSRLYSDELFPVLGTVLTFPTAIVGALVFRSVSRAAQRDK